jgi:hypothetical protein
LYQFQVPFLFKMRVVSRTPLTILLLPSVHSLTIPRNPQDCNAFSQNAPSIQNVTLINSTLILAYENTSSFCKVLGQVAYGSNDTLNFQLWLPDADSYNGRFMAVGNFPISPLKSPPTLTRKGNGGMAGTIDTNAMQSQLNSGFAVAG